MSTPDFGKASENGSDDEDVGRVDGDSLLARERSIEENGGRETSETVEDLRRENRELREEVEELRETVEEMRQFVGMHVKEDLDIHCLAPVVERNMEKTEKMVRDQEAEEYVPGTKNEKIKKLIEDNFDEWSISLKGGDAVATRVQQKKKRTRNGETIHQHVMDAMDEEYGENVDHRQVHHALGDLSKTDRYRLEETDSAKYLFKDS